MFEDQKFYIGQKALIEKDDQLLILSMSDISIDFPGGKIQLNELSPSAALKREVFEETTLHISIGDPFHTWISKYPTKEEPNRVIFFIAYLCKYTSGKIKLSDEHSSYKWINKDNYQDLKENSPWFEVINKYFKTSDQSN